ncbi:hypothetical protein PK28_16060 [Hymenobacter sp. DG25B]|nr:hypothetical protein PK28_16060 [Hymenobacter sp. DG25B]
MTLTSNAASVCTGGTVTLTASGSSGTYTWYQDGVLQSETGATIIRTNLLATTTFLVSAPTTSCGTSSQELVVPVNSLTLTPTTATVCSGGSATFTAAYTGSNATFNWYNAANTLVYTSIGTTSSYTDTNVAGNTSYRVDAVTADCGTTLSQTASVTIGALTAAISPSAPTVCAGSAVTLTASSNNPNVTYQWQSQGANGNYSNIAGATSSTYSVFTASNNTNPENYQVVVSSTNCSAVSVPVTVTKVAAAINSLSTSPSSATVCAGSPVTLTAASNISNARFVWYTTAGQSLSTSATYSPSPTTTTTYQVDIISGCGTQTLSSTITVNPKPTIMVTPGSAFVQPGGSAVLTASGATAYSWSPATGLNTTSGASVTATPSATTTYTVTGTNANGCVNTSTVTVTVASVILPVELVEFKAVWHGQSPKLTWATAFEKENAMFLIERSYDGITFEVIGQQQGAGNSQNRTSYRYTDGALPVSASGTVYYRLRQVDVTGSFSYSDVKTVQVPTKRRNFAASVYPNPYEKALTVEVETLGTNDIICTVYDVVGKRLITRKVAAKGTITQEIDFPEAASLHTGMYYLRVQQGGQSQVIRLNRK